MQNFLRNHNFGESLAPAEREAEFLRELELVYHNLYTTGLTIVGNRDDADDVMQEACVVLWQKIEEFESGTNFRRWASTVVLNVARAFARKRRHRLGFGLSDYALMKVAQVKSGASELLELQCEVLQECLGRLPQREREFLTSCYRNSTTLTSHAHRLGLSVETVYTRLKRLRRRLAECMSRGLERRGE